MKTSEEMQEQLKPCPLCENKVTLGEVSKSWTVEDRDFGGGSGSSYMHNTYNVITCSCSLEKTLSKKACDMIYGRVQAEVVTEFASVKFDPNKFNEQLAFERELYEKYKLEALIAEWNNRV